MSPQAEPRASMDRVARDGTYDYQPGHRQHNYQPSNLPPNAAYAGRANGYGPVDVPRQRNGSSSVLSTQAMNGSPVPNSESRSGPERHTTQDRPSRERSRPNGAAGSKSGTPRICKECDQPLTGQFVRALGGTFHLECFLCRVRITRDIGCGFADFCLGLWTGCCFKVFSSR